MKRTENINIGGVPFHVDDDAFLLLKGYIERLEAWFKDREGGLDVVHDIELRLSEIFTEKTRGGELIVTRQMVQEAILLLGQPEEFEGEDVKVDEPAMPFKAPRRLYRDKMNSVLGGVCSGLAAYLDMDVSLVRLLFVVLPFLSFGGIVLVYLVLWIALPVAVTPAQRLEMRGEPITVSNIEKKVADGFNAMRDDVHDIRTRWFTRRNRRQTTMVLVVLFLLLFFSFKGFHFPPFLWFSQGHFPVGLDFIHFPMFFKGAFYGLIFVGCGMLFKGGLRMTLVVVGLLILVFSFLRWIVFLLGAPFGDFFVYI